VTSRDVAAILLVRAVEETRPSAVPPATQVDALGAAGDPDDAGAWFTRRAAYLLRHALGDYRAVLEIVAVPERLAGPIFLIAFLVGLLSNYLGPTSKIHVLVNPMSVLILWNLAIYALTALRAVTKGVRADVPRPPAEATAVVGVAEAASPTPGPANAAQERRPVWWLRPLVPAIWERWRRTAHEAGARVADLPQIARAFWASWITTAGPLVGTTARRLLHAAAIGVALGAIAGMYVRGLFFEYNVVWRSTFIRDFDAVQTLLALLLGPAAALLGQGPPSEAETALLMTPAGAPAARWIHLYAASMVLFILIPRAALAAAAWLRERRLARHLTPRFAAPYYRAILEQARTLRVAELAEAIQEDVRVECGAFADAIATFVCSELYDRRIVPRLETFRREGGRIATLEADVREACVGFQIALEGYLPIAHADLERSLSRSVARTIGRDLPVETGTATGLMRDVDSASQSTAARLGSSVGVEIADVVALAVSAATAVVAGTVAGGFGKSLGVAVVAALLGTTGPLAFVIGAAGAFALVAAGWWIGRDQLTDAVKQIPLPTAVARIALRDARLREIVDQGRERCRLAVSTAMRQTLEPLAPTIAEQIWTRIKPLLVS
jgi:hypothetical protein